MRRRHAQLQHLRTLRLLGALSVAIPLVVAALFGTYRYVQTQRDAAQQVDRSLRVLHENAKKIVSSAETAAARARSLVEGRAPAVVRGDAALYEALGQIVRDQDQIQAILVAGPDGVLLASSRRSAGVGVVSAADRAYFQYQRMGPPGRYYLSGPLLTRGTGEKVMNLTLGFAGPDGGFGGVVIVSVRAAYFESLYADLATGEPGLALAAFAADGSLYARWPPVAGVERLPADSPFMKELAAGRKAGRVRGTSPVDGEDRLMGYQQVGAYPAYVAAGVSITALRGALMRDLAVLLALGLPAFAVLWLAIRSAARRAGESAEALRLLDDETASRKRAEETLAQSQRLEALGRVAGGVAHEFNNMLMVIGTNLHLARRAPPEALARRFDSIGRAVDASTQLTRQLLSFTRRQALAPVAVDLAEFLPRVAPLLAPVLGGRVEFRVEVAPQTAVVQVDTAEFELALVNLAINARDAMPDGGTFTLRAHPVPPGPEGFFVAVSAGDTGVGIAPEILARVFEPFFTTKEVGAGTGLGLSQVHAMCERAGGAVRIDSTPGQGTTVTLLFPAAAGPAAQAGAAPAEDATPLRKRVLLAEDDPAVAEATLALLEELGCAAEWVASAAAALERLGAPGGEAPDLVVSDVRMPGPLDGLGLAKRLRAERPGLPVLLVTGYTEAMAEIEREGFAALPKPFTAEALRAALLRVGAGAGAGLPR